MKTKLNNIVMKTHIFLGDQQDEQKKIERKLQLVRFCGLFLRKALCILDLVPTDEKINDL